jgi:hypothetical protein
MVQELLTSWQKAGGRGGVGVVLVVVVVVVVVVAGIVVASTVTSWRLRKSLLSIWTSTYLNMIL